MIAADREYAIAAQEVEVADSIAVIQVLPASPAKTDIVPDGPQHTDHLLVEAAGVEAETLGFVGCEKRRNIDVQILHAQIAPGLAQPSARQIGSNAA